MVSTEEQPAVHALRLVRRKLSELLQLTHRAPLPCPAPAQVIDSGDREPVSYPPSSLRLSSSTIVRRSVGRGGLWRRDPSRARPIRRVTLLDAARPGLLLLLLLCFSFVESFGLFLLRPSRSFGHLEVTPILARPALGENQGFRSIFRTFVARRRRRPPSVTPRHDHGRAQGFRRSRRSAPVLSITGQSSNRWRDRSPTAGAGGGPDGYALRTWRLRPSIRQLAVTR